MTKREIERAKKKLFKSLGNLTDYPRYQDEYNIETNKETIGNFKFYSGFDEKEKRKVRSITLAYKNDDFITEIQGLAKLEGNFISKDIIINIALFNLKEETENTGFLTFTEWLNNYTK